MIELKDILMIILLLLVAQGIYLLYLSNLKKNINDFNIKFPDVNKYPILDKPNIIYKKSLIEDQFKNQDYNFLLQNASINAV